MWYIIYSLKKGERRERKIVLAIGIIMKIDSSSEMIFFFMQNTPFLLYPVATIILGNLRLSKLENNTEKIINCYRSVSKRGREPTPSWTFGTLLTGANIL